MNNEITKALEDRGAGIIRFASLEGLPKEQTLGFPNAVLFCMPLSKEYINNTISKGFQLDYKNDEYLAKEAQVEELADWLASYLVQKGYSAHSQSEKSNKKSGYLESGYKNPSLQEGISILPQKTIARIAGLGFIGKNNLLVTESYGCAITMCSVLTNAPVRPGLFAIIDSKCGSCEECVLACPANALLGNEWSMESGRDSIVDVSKCSCPLRCMFSCPHTLEYANS
ncbi:MAG: 4Fe-4S binding protein [Eubacteriaceae bacterium]|nr:4Fe-4S binding protein [Eubacteriaceae bacterium]